MFPRITLVLGGASSGKSAFAENLVLSDNRAPVYLATSQAFDAEMDAKIAAHKQARDESWHTIEEPFEAAKTLTTFTKDQVVLLDCLTLWLTNHMLADHDLGVETDRLIQALNGCAAPVVLVSNEIGQGVVPDTQLARRFRDAQGKLNQSIAAQADLVVAVMAGLPLVLKGKLP